MARQGCLVSVAGEAGRHAPTWQQSFDELRSLQAEQHLISGGHFLYPKTLDPLSSDTTVRLVLRLGCGGARALRDSGRSLEHDEKAQPAH